LRKPPMYYWILSAAESVGGENTWAWRVPSAGASALTGLAIYCFATVWFGRAYGAVAGFGFLSIVALWSQSRSIDIDASNTLAATLTACVMVHLHVRRYAGNAGTGTVVWAFLGALAFGAALLLKGPGALPVVLGALIGPVVVYRRWLWSTAGVMVGGVLLAGAYAWLAHWTAGRYGIVPDVSGVKEGIQNLLPRDLTRLLRAAALSPQLFAFALPTSIGLVLAFHPLVLKVPDDPVRRVVRALAWSVLVGWGVCFVSGMVNPRYGYVTLPLLAALSGGVVRVFRKTGPDDSRAAADRFFRTVLTCTAVIVIGATVALTIVTWNRDNLRAALVCGIVLSVVVGTMTLRSLTRKPLGEAAAGTLTLFVLLTLPFAALELKTRTARSGLVPAGLIRDAVGEGTRVTAGRLVADQPELFYYANVNVDSVGDDLSDPARIKSRRWLVLDRREWEIWQAHAGTKLSRVTQTTSNKVPVIVAWYGE